MSDLLTRLRKLSETAHYSEAYREAVARIEQLEADVKRLEEALATCRELREYDRAALERK